MPGINFIIDFRGYLKDKKSRIIQAQKSLIHSDEYFHKILMYDTTIFLGFVKYNNYPITTFENSRFFICIEGKIYNKDNSVIEREINEIAENIFSKSGNTKECIKNWLLDSDGDYIVLVLDKTSKEVVIINDALGRLPLYFYESNAQSFISREIKFITSFVEKIKFDKMAIAEYLLFGYPLGEKTLLKNIFRLQPATLIRINPLKSKIEMDNIHTFNFENKRYKGESLKNNVDQLKKLFLKSCENRANSIDNCKNVVSLSGGLDSRTVAAGFHNISIQCYGVTWLDLPKTATAMLDVSVAKELAKVLNMEWKFIESKAPPFSSALSLLKIKDGLNYLAMSYILPLFARIKVVYDNRLIYFTGDGGNEVFPDITPTKKMKNLDKLVDYIMQKNSTYNLDDIEVLIKVKKGEIKDEIKKHIERYPENDLNQKYVHFLSYGRAFKWAFEGEDRNRFYFWSTTPFYAIHLFDYAMNCPDKQKRRYKLYRSFLLELSPQVSAVTNANWGIPISSIKSNLYLYIGYIYNKLPQKLINIHLPEKLREKRIKKTVEGKKYEYSQEVKNCILEQITSCPSILEYFSNIELRRFIERGVSLTQLYNLFTVISYIELIECGRSTLEKYIESDL